MSTSSFRSLLHCPHALFLDHHGNPDLKTDLGEFERYLLDEGKRFEQEFVAGKDYIQPDYPDGDLDAGAQATAQLMRIGTPLIYQGVLRADRFVGMPDLLVKKCGKSTFGDWFYEPHEIKISKSVKPFHILQVCFYAMLLESIQGHRPEAATVVLANESEGIIDLVEAWPEFERRLAEAIAIVDRNQETDLAIFSGCGECVWHDVCAREALRRNDVTLVADLRRAAKPDLTDTGIVTVADLADADAERLTKFRGIGSKSAERLIVQARSQTTGTVVQVGESPLPESPVELYYDIEGEPNLDMDYLHGLLIVKHGKEPHYLAFLADQPENEGEAFGRFVGKIVEILERHPMTPIYHYHSYERTRVTKLFECYPDHAPRVVPHPPRRTPHRLLPRLVAEPPSSRKSDMVIRGVIQATNPACTVGADLNNNRSDRSALIPYPGNCQTYPPSSHNSLLTPRLTSKHDFSPVEIDSMEMVVKSPPYLLLAEPLDRGLHAFTAKEADRHLVPSPIVDKILLLPQSPGSLASFTPSVYFNPADPR